MVTPYFSAPVAAPAHLRAQLELEETIIRPHISLSDDHSSHSTSTECHICTSTYDSSLDSADSNHVRAVIHNCGHAFGSSCLGIWFEYGAASFYEDDTSLDKAFRCPMCRGDIFGEDKIAVAGMYHVLARWRGENVDMNVEESVNQSLEMAEVVFAAREEDQELGHDDERAAPRARDQIGRMPRGVEEAFMVYLGQLRQHSPTMLREEGGIVSDEENYVVASESNFNLLRSIVPQIFETDRPINLSMVEFDEAYNYVQNISNAALIYMLDRFKVRTTTLNEVGAVEGMSGRSNGPDGRRRVHSSNRGDGGENVYPQPQVTIDEASAAHNAVATRPSRSIVQEDSDDDLSERGSVDPWALDYESESEDGIVSGDED